MLQRFGYISLNIVAEIGYISPTFQKGPYSELNGASFGKQLVFLAQRQGPSQQYSSKGYENVQLFLFSQVTFLNSVIVDLQHKNEELKQRLEAMESGVVVNGAEDSMEVL